LEEIVLANTVVQRGQEEEEDDTEAEHTHFNLELLDVELGTLFLLQELLLEQTTHDLHDGGDQGQNQTENNGIFTLTFQDGLPTANNILEAHDSTDNTSDDDPLQVGVGLLQDELGEELRKGDPQLTELLLTLRLEEVVLEKHEDVLEVEEHLRNDEVLEGLEPEHLHDALLTVKIEGHQGLDAQVDQGDENVEGNLVDDGVLDGDELEDVLQDILGDETDDNDQLGHETLLVVFLLVLLRLLVGLLGGAVVLVFPALVEVLILTLLLALNLLLLVLGEEVLGVLLLGDLGLQVLLLIVTLLRPLLLDLVLVLTLTQGLLVGLKELLLLGVSLLSVLLVLLLLDLFLGEALLGVLEKLDLLVDLVVLRVHLVSNLGVFAGHFERCSL